MYPDDVEIRSLHTGDLYSVRYDTAEPGVMIDTYWLNSGRAQMQQARDAARLEGEPWLKSIPREQWSRLPGDRNPDEADRWSYIPWDCVRQVGEALIAFADACEDEWREEAN